MSEYNNTYTLCAQPKHYSTINYVLINALKKVSLVLNSSYFIPSFLLRGKYYLEFLSNIVLFFFVVWAHLCIFMQYTAFFLNMFLNFTEMNHPILTYLWSDLSALTLSSFTPLHIPAIHFHLWCPLYTHAIIHLYSLFRLLIAFSHGPLSLFCFFILDWILHLWFFSSTQMKIKYIFLFFYSLIHKLKNV